MANFGAALAGILPPEQFGAVRPAAPKARGLPAGGAAPASGIVSVAPKPILQLATLPITIDPAQFANARSNANPSGDLRPLYLFSELVDAIPSFARSYSPSGLSLQRSYAAIVGGAATSDTFTAALISSAAQTLQQGGFQNMDGTPGSWYPAYAEPGDWTNMQLTDRFSALVIDLRAAAQAGSGGAADAPFAVLGGSDDAILSTGDGAAPKSLDAGSTIHSVSLKYMPVQIVRPWLQYGLFKSAGWFLGHQPVGFCSSGDTADNPGIFPLLTTYLLLARDVSVSATLAPVDQARIDAATAKDATVSIGPFAIDATALQVIGFVSTLVPLSPAMAAPA